MLPPPVLTPHGGKPSRYAAAGAVASARAADDLTLNLVIPALAQAGLEPLPPDGASEADIEAWVDRFIDASATPAREEIDHAR